MWPFTLHGYWKQEMSQEPELHNIYHTLHVLNMAFNWCFIPWKIKWCFITQKIIFTWIQGGMRCLMLTVGELEGNFPWGVLRHLHCTVGLEHIGMQFRLSKVLHRRHKVLWIQVMQSYVSMGQKNNFLQRTFKLHENVMLMLSSGQNQTGCQESYGREERTKQFCSFANAILYIHGEYHVHLWSPHLQKGVAEGVKLHRV